MKNLVVCFAIACLSLASGAPTDEESKVISKTFNYDNKDVIYSTDNPFWKDDMVYAVCEGSDVEKNCKVYMHSASKDTVQSCDLSLKYSNSFRDSNLFNAGNSRAVFAVRDGATRIKLISVNLKDCQIGETGVDVPLPLPNHVLSQLHVVIVPHEKNYDVVYRNRDLCHDFLCKATFDYEGKAVKAPSSFAVPDSDSNKYDIKAVKNAYLVSCQWFAYTSVYLVHENDTKPHTLLDCEEGISRPSTEENKLGFCTSYDEILRCRQYDSEGKTKINEMVTGTHNRNKLLHVQDVLNLERGLLTVVDEFYHTTRSNFVTHFDEKGGKVKSVEVDLKCDLPKYLLPKLYKNSNGEYCVTSLCLAYTDDWEYQTAFSRNTRCFHEAELF